MIYMTEILLPNISIIFNTNISPKKFKTFFSFLYNTKGENILKYHARVVEVLYLHSVNEG